MNIDRANRKIFTFDPDKPIPRHKPSNKLVHGVGINDADYQTQITEQQSDLSYKVVWQCPYYLRWVSMLTRCYSKRYQTKQPSYIGCFVCTEWHTFSNFRVWMMQQEWEGLELDKDLLVSGNKEYSPETCVFIPSFLNKFAKSLK